MADETHIPRLEADPNDVAVLLLFHARPETFGQVFASVREYRPSRLFLYQDGPRDERDLPGIEACRRIAEQVDWPCDVRRFYQEKNVGCDPSEYISQKWAFSLAERVIVLEDDDVPSQSFFTFCREMLERYADDERITMIAGFNTDCVTPDTRYDYFFTSVFSIWGWASWRRVVDQWDEHYSFVHDPEAMARLAELARQRGYRKGMLPMFRQHAASGKAYYETIFWASMLLNSGLAIMPAKNLVNNIGLTGDSTHFSATLQTMPRRLRSQFTMPRHELTFPLNHPPYVIDHVAYKERNYRLNAYGHPLIKVGYSLEELFLNLRHGRFRHIGQALARRLRIWMGRKKHA